MFAKDKSIYFNRDFCFDTQFFIKFNIEDKETWWEWRLLPWWPYLHVTNLDVHLGVTPLLTSCVFFL